MHTSPRFIAGKYIFSNPLRDHNSYAIFSLLISYHGLKRPTGWLCLVRKGKKMILWLYEVLKPRRLLFRSGNKLSVSSCKLSCSEIGVYFWCWYARLPLQACVGTYKTMVGTTYTKVCKSSTAHTASIGFVFSFSRSGNMMEKSRFIWPSLKCFLWFLYRVRLVLNFETFAVFIVLENMFRAGTLPWDSALIHIVFD